MDSDITKPWAIRIVDSTEEEGVKADPLGGVIPQERLTGDVLRGRGRVEAISKGCYVTGGR